MASTDKTVYGDFTFEKLLKEIHQNQQTKAKLIVDLINDLRPLINSVPDAIAVAPIIAQLMNISVTNDEKLVKMGQLVEKIVRATLAEAKQDEGPTEKEMKEWLKELGNLEDEVEDDLPALPEKYTGREEADL